MLPAALVCFTVHKTLVAMYTNLLWRCFSTLDVVNATAPSTQMSKQPRFSLAKSADLRRMNLGATGSSPALLLKLFEHCRHLIALNLWGAFLEVTDYLY